MRPGGLTALAIFNFIFGGLGTLLAILSLALASTVHAQLELFARAMGESPPSLGVLYGIYAFSLVRGGILIFSAIGYLGLRKFAGRKLGNTYAVMAFLAIILEATLLPSMFTTWSLVEFVYPLITLFLLNVTFRKDFVR